jgi:hypothetical protein
MKDCEGQSYTEARLIQKYSISLLDDYEFLFPTLKPVSQNLKMSSLI